MTLWLSPNKSVEPVWGKSILVSKRRNHTASLVATQAAIYYDFVVDCAVHCCVLELEEMRLEPSWKTYHDLDQRELISPP